MLLKIDRERPEPLYRQVIAGIRALVDDGTIEAGRPLPSSRRRRHPRDRLRLSAPAINRV